VYGSLGNNSRASTPDSASCSSVPS
jgi:hypothetical protein